jgi:hypothetical protein
VSITQAAAALEASAKVDAPMTELTKHLDELGRLCG